MLERINETISPSSGKRCFCFFEKIKSLFRTISNTPPPLGINFVCKGNELKDDYIKIERSYNEIIIEAIPIADQNNPRLPRDYFDQILRRISELNLPKNLFSKARYLNLHKITFFPIFR